MHAKEQKKKERLQPFSKVFNNISPLSFIIIIGVVMYEKPLFCFNIPHTLILQQLHFTMAIHCLPASSCGSFVPPCGTVCGRRAEEKLLPLGWHHDDPLPYRLVGGCSAVLPSDCCEIDSLSYALDTDHKFATST